VNGTSGFERVLKFLRPDRIGDWERGFGVCCPTELKVRKELIQKKNAGDLAPPFEVLFMR
jgi:hypothetical protein